jgi:hypothetical protein
MARRPAACQARSSSTSNMQRRVRRDHAAGAARAVAELGRDHEHARAAFLHALHALVPALDDMAGAEVELERVVAVLARIELGALDAVLVQPAGVVDRDRRAGLGVLARAGHGVVVLEAGGGGLHESPSERRNRE